MPNPQSFKTIEFHLRSPRIDRLPTRWLGIGIVFFATLIAGGIAITGYWMVRSMLLDGITRNVLLEVNKESEDIDRWLTIRMAEVQSIASNPTVKTLDWNIIHPYFDQEVNRIQDFVSLSIGYPDGTYYNSYIGGRLLINGNRYDNISDRNYFKKAIAGESNISDPFISRTLKTNNIAIATPIWQDGYRTKAPIAEIHAQVKVDRLAEVIQSLRYGDGSYAFVVNEKGEAIIHPDRNLMTLAEKPAPSLLHNNDPGLAQLAVLMAKGEHGITLSKIAGTQTYVAYVPLKAAKWSIALVIPKQNIESQLATLNLFAIVLMTLPIGAAAFAWRQVQLVRQAKLRLQLLQNQKHNLKQYQKLLKQRSQEAQLTLENLQRTQSHLLNSQAMSSLGQLLVGMMQEIKTPNQMMAQQITYSQGQLQTINVLFQKLVSKQPKPSSPWTERSIQTAAQAIANLDNGFQAMQGNIDRVHSLLQALKGLTQNHQQLESIDINLLLDDTLRLLAHRLSQQSNRQVIQMIRQYADLPTLECYVAQTHQLFVHLLNNAIDAIETRFHQGAQTEQPAIRIRTQLMHSGQVLIRITDNGCGIPEGNQTKLFKPFFTTKSNHQGIGLGLFICQNIVYQHKGDIRCISIPNRGTDILVELPLKQSRKKTVFTHQNQQQALELEKLHARQADPETNVIPATHLLYPLPSISQTDQAQPVQSNGKHPANHWMNWI